MRISRSVGAQLFAALVAVVSIALATTYLMVVPTLERRLVSNKLDELERSARPVATRVADTESPALRSYVEEAASAVDARVVVFDVIGRPLQLLPQADSLRTGTAAIAKDRIALEAMKTARTIRGTVSRGSGRHAEVAEFVPGTNRVILLSSPLGDTRRSVASVRGQLLIAALPSLLIALAIGLIGARTLTSRIRRLERAANRIAAGSLDDPVEEEGADEVGQLAHSFERMRLRLAQLEGARREFIANASHELRTPIFALSGSLELLAEEEMDESSRREFVETMRDQVERLKRLAIALLDLSRLDAGKLDPTFQPLALASVVETLKDEFRAVAELSGHPFSIVVADAPIVVADEQRTLQIGRILLENAFVHTPRGVSVSVRTETKADSGLVTVEDAGAGIPGDHQERVFERFVRLAGDRSAGSGLGLAIAREWAMRMNGDVTLESRPGLTRFSLELPLVSGNERKAAAD